MGRAKKRGGSIASSNCPSIIPGWSPLSLGDCFRFLSLIEEFSCPRKDMPFCRGICRLMDVPKFESLFRRSRWSQLDTAMANVRGAAACSHVHAHPHGSALPPQLRPTNVSLGMSSRAGVLCQTKYSPVAINLVLIHPDKIKRAFFEPTSNAPHTLLV